MLYGALSVNAFYLYYIYTLKNAMSPLFLFRLYLSKVWDVFQLSENFCRISMAILLHESPNLYPLFCCSFIPLWCLSVFLPCFSDLNHTCSWFLLFDLFPLSSDMGFKRSLSLWWDTESHLSFSFVTCLFFPLLFVFTYPKLNVPGLHILRETLRELNA